ncbi:MAG TPA: M48 family metallopeptidase [Candidatus Paceibacterota bacterium]
MLFTFRVTRRRRVRRGATNKSRAEHKLLGAAARALVTERLDYFNRHYGFIYGKVFIRNTRTRWGSCSSRGNLGFNYRIIKLSPHLADYIVVHELCHLKEFNHSPQFWALVAETVPEWKLLRRELRRHRLG